MNGEKWREELENIAAIYGDFSKFQIGQLSFLRSVVESTGEDVNKLTSHDLIVFLQKLDHTQKSLLSEVDKLGKILLFIPATNAINKKSLTASKRTKTYLRATSNNKRMNPLMFLHIHKE